MMALNINQLALATGSNTTPFGIGMPTPMDDTRQKINEQIKNIYAMGEEDSSREVIIDRKYAYEP